MLQANVARQCGAQGVARIADRGRKMLKRFYKKDSSNWVVRASVEDERFIEIQAGEHLIFVTPATARGLEQERSWGKWLRQA